jgi:hypothetical protein
MVVFNIGSLAGHWVAFALFGGMAALTGYAACHIARKFTAPPAERPYLGTTPWARRTIGTVVASVLLIGIWFWLWSGFHRIEVTPDTITLRYEMPPRSQVISASRIERVYWRPGRRFTRVLVVATDDGLELRSMQSSRGRDADQALLETLRRALGRESAR